MRRSPNDNDLDVAVREERRRLRAIVRTIRGTWRRRMDSTSGEEFEGAARAVQALDEVLVATRKGGR